MNKKTSINKRRVMICFLITGFFLIGVLPQGLSEEIETDAGSILTYSPAQYLDAGHQSYITAHANAMDWRSPAHGCQFSIGNNFNMMINQILNPLVNLLHQEAKGTASRENKVFLPYAESYADGLFIQDVSLNAEGSFVTMDISSTCEALLKLCVYHPQFEAGGAIGFNSLGELLPNVIFEPFKVRIPFTVKNPSPGASVYLYIRDSFLKTDHGVGWSDCQGSAGVTVKGYWEIKPAGYGSPIVSDYYEVTTRGVSFKEWMGNREFFISPGNYVFYAEYTICGKASYITNYFRTEREEPNVPGIDGPGDSCLEKYFLSDSIFSIAVDFYQQ